MINLLDQETIDAYKKPIILVVPPGVKDMKYDQEKNLGQYIDEGWVVQNVGISPDHTQPIPGNLRAQRRQYGLKHYVTSIIHSSMGDTLRKVLMEISDIDHSFKLWGKQQIIVALSRTKLYKSSIFVGDKRGTINDPGSFIKTRTKCTDYMDTVFCLVSINGENNSQYISVFEYTTYSFLVADITFPEYNNGFVYMIMSIKDPSFVYIGETKYIRTQLIDHNSGQQPYTIVACICVLDGNNILRCHIEQQCQLSMHSLMRRGITGIKPIIRSARYIIDRDNTLIDAILPFQLKLILLFIE